MAPVFLPQLCPRYYGVIMEIVSSLVSLTVAKLLQFSGLAENRNVLKTKKMEEKALEVYGEPVDCLITDDQMD